MTERIKYEDLERYRMDAKASFAPNSGCWIGPDKRPAMIIAKEDMLWFLKCVDLIEEIERKSHAIIR